MKRIHFYRRLNKNEQATSKNARNENRTQRVIIFYVLFTFRESVIICRQPNDWLPLLLLMCALCIQFPALLHDLCSSPHLVSSRQANLYKKKKTIRFMITSSKCENDFVFSRPTVDEKNWASRKASTIKLNTRAACLFANCFVCCFSFCSFLPCASDRRSHETHLCTCIWIIGFKMMLRFDTFVGGFVDSFLSLHFWLEFCMRAN